MLLLLLLWFSSSASSFQPLLFLSCGKTIRQRQRQRPLQRAQDVVSLLPKSSRRAFLLVDVDGRPVSFSRIQNSQNSDNSNIVNEQGVDDDDNEDAILLATLESKLDTVAQHYYRYQQQAVPEHIIQKDLVRRGKAFASTHNSELLLTATAGVVEKKKNENKEQQQLLRFVSPTVKVSGCIANVYLQTVIEVSLPSSSSSPSSSNNNRQHDDKSNNFRVASLHGTADALVSQGLLALWSYLCTNVNVHDILHLQPHTLSQRLGLQGALSPGRNDGLASMVRTTQHQIQDALLVLRRNNTNSNNNNSTISSSNIIQEEQQISNLVGNNDNNVKEEDPTNSHQQQQQQQQQQQKQKRVALLLSGGVDSAVALNLLIRQEQQGGYRRYNVTAFYLKIWLEDEASHLGTCPWQDDYQMCQDICRHVYDSTGIHVPLHAMSLQNAYRDHVISYTITEARHGRTPNPDIMCNSRIKFGCFYDEIMNMNTNSNSNNEYNGHFDYIATGHYAQLIDSNDNDQTLLPPEQQLQPKRKRLLRAPDPVKDQSYFLCTLTQAQLSRVLFPIGHLQKHQVRDLANTWQLPNRNRPDSQGLCFLGKIKFENFLQIYLGHQPGPIVDTRTGACIGQHLGLWFHTVGQRRGIGKVLNPIATSQGPWYVVAKDVKRNIVYCSNEYNNHQKDNDSDLFTAPRSQFTVENIHWIAGHAPSPPPPPPPRYQQDHDNANSDSDDENDVTTTTMNRPTFYFTMKIRHGPRLVHGSLTLTSTTTGGDVFDESKVGGSDDADTQNIARVNNDCGIVHLNEKDSGLAPGQYVSFYQDDECLGGGVISENHWTTFLRDFEQQQQAQQQHRLSSSMSAAAA